VLCRKLHELATVLLLPSNVWTAEASRRYASQTGRPARRREDGFGASRRAASEAEPVADCWNRGPVRISAAGTDTSEIAYENRLRGLECGEHFL
jgi:hypothetical protein